MHNGSLSGLFNWLFQQMWIKSRFPIFCCLKEPVIVLQISEWLKEFKVLAFFKMEPRWSKINIWETYSLHPSTWFLDPQCCTGQSQWTGKQLKVANSWTLHLQEPSADLWKKRCFLLLCVGLRMVSIWYYLCIYMYMYICIYVYMYLYIGTYTRIIPTDKHPVNEI